LPNSKGSPNLERVSKNHVKAREFFEEVETRGYKDGWMFNTLGEMYRDGLGNVQENLKKAEAYFKKVEEKKKTFYNYAIPLEREGL
jgi:TPR repeat protein